MKKSWFAAAVCAATVASVGTNAAFAGEITGNGTLKPVNGNSLCAYSGQEDLQWYMDDGNTMLKPNPTKGDPGHSQSWGQIVKANGPLGGANDTTGVTPEPSGCNAHLYGLKN